LSFLPLAIWATFFIVCLDLSNYINFKMGNKMKEETIKFWAGFYLFGLIIFTILGFLAKH